MIKNNLLRYNQRTEKEEISPTIDAFLKDIKQVCIKHNMSISHEDCHGGFIIEEFSDMFYNWLFSADIGESLSEEFPSNFKVIKKTFFKHLKEF